VFSTEGSVQLKAGNDGARFLLLAGRPIGEPVVQYGPFVMNTRQEIEQAIRDYQAGTLAGA
jgi:quercetin 2,3-dioxygenase